MSAELSIDKCHSQGLLFPLFSLSKCKKFKTSKLNKINVNSKCFYIKKLNFRKHMHISIKNLVISIYALIVLFLRPFLKFGSEGTGSSLLWFLGMKSVTMNCASLIEQELQLVCLEQVH